MLGQPRGGYGTIIIAWQPSMQRTAAHKNCPATSSLKSLQHAAGVPITPAAAMHTQTKPMCLKSSPAVEERVISHR